jgi:outer membrane receptor protein involved in Fe transport
VAGARGDFVDADDKNYYGGISGKPSQQAFEPKISLIFGPFHQTEFYASAGQGFHTNDVRDGTSTILGGSADTGFTRSPLIVKSTGADIGLRTDAIPDVHLGVSFFLVDFQSELTYDGDVGTTDAGPASHRIGFEATAQYRPQPWLELSGNFAATRSRYVDNIGGGVYIPDAPTFIGSFGVLVDNLGPWFGGLEVRALGPHPLTDDDSQNARGYTEVNLDVGYHVTDSLKVQLSIFNLFNTRGASSEYYYVSRLPGEPSAGVGDHSIHPLEPLSARLGVTATF